MNNTDQLTKLSNMLIEVELMNPQSLGLENVSCISDLIDQCNALLFPQDD